jgi:hypothetical protein
MAPQGKPMVVCNLNLKFGVPLKLARRASEKALAAYLARVIGESFQGISPEFVVNLAGKVKADIKAKAAPRLIVPGQKPLRV